MNSSKRVSTKAAFRTTGAVNLKHGINRRGRSTWPYWLTLLVAIGAEVATVRASAGAFEAADLLQLEATLEANILANRLTAALGLGVSVEDPQAIIPGTEAHDRLQAARAAAKKLSIQGANQGNPAAITASYIAQYICAGVKMQGLSPLLIPTLLSCANPSDCQLQEVANTGLVADLPSNAMLLTLPGNCSCPYPRTQYFVRQDSFSPQDLTTHMATPLLVFSARYGCQVLQRVSENLQQSPVVPVYTDDGVPPVHFDWPVATKGSPGAFPNVDYDLILSQIGQFFQETAPPDVDPQITASQTFAIAVFYKGSLIAEQYALSQYGVTPHTRYPSNSLHKTFFVNYLTGLRCVEGKMSIDDLVGSEYWGEEFVLERAIKVDNLLRVNGGITADEVSDANAFMTQPDSPTYVAGLPLSNAPPGAVWEYSDGGYLLAAKAIRNSFDNDTSAYWSYPFNRLYKKVGAPSVILSMDSVGNLLQSARGGDAVSGMAANAYDYAKLGSVFLNEGKFQGMDILPSKWIEYSLTPSPSSNNTSSDAYGASWWLGGYPTLPLYNYQAIGAGLQRVVIVPEKELMMLHLTSGTFAHPRSSEWQRAVGTFLFANITAAIH